MKQQFAWFVLMPKGDIYPGEWGSVGGKTRKDALCNAFDDYCYLSTTLDAVWVDYKAKGYTVKRCRVEMPHAD